jgi:hypothetical protein
VTSQAEREKLAAVFAHPGVEAGRRRPGGRLDLPVVADLTWGRILAS